jgi:hypothetical protein
MAPLAVSVSSAYGVCFACTAAAKVFVYAAMDGQTWPPAGGSGLPSILAGTALATRQPVDVAALAAWRKSVKPRARKAA